MFKLDDTVGNIVTEFPGAAEILKENRIDFCCGGDRKLENAVKEDLNQNVAPETILNEINAFLQLTLPQLSELTTKILRAHRENHGILFARLEKKL